MVNKQIIEERIKICSSCENCNLPMCKLSGNSVIIMATSDDNICPLNLWTE